MPKGTKRLVRFVKSETVVFTAYTSYLLTRIQTAAVGEKGCNMEYEKLFAPEVVDLIMKIVRKGNAAEIKKENNKLVIVEIERRVRNKTSITG